MRTVTESQSSEGRTLRFRRWTLLVAAAVVVFGLIGRELNYEQRQK